jgi:hypothetical protein
VKLKLPLLPLSVPQIMCGNIEKYLIFLEESSFLEEDQFGHGNTVVGHTGVSESTKNMPTL